MRSNESMRSSVAAYSPSVIVRSPTLANVLAAISGESGFGPAGPLAEVAGAGSLFFLEQAAKPGSARSATGQKPLTRRLRTRAAPRAAPSLESIGAGEYYEPVRPSSHRPGTRILRARRWKGKREAWNRKRSGGS